MNIHPRHLRMFLALAESLNFSKTAEQLFMTQPSLSKSIRDLEAELGLALFERSTRNVHLTAAGERLLSQARVVIGEYDAGLQRMRNLAEREALQLSVAAWPSLAQVLLPQLCSLLEQRFQEPRLTVHDGANSACLKLVLNYEADFALASVAPSHPDLAYQELVRDRFVLLASGRWRKQLPQELRLQDLQTLPLITLSNASTAMRYMSAAYLQRGVEYRPKMQVEQIATVAELVKKEIGVAVLPYLGVLPILDGRSMQMSAIVDGPLRSMGLVTRRLGHPSSMANTAMQEVQILCQQLITQHPGWVLPPSSERRRRLR